MVTIILIHIHYMKSDGQQHSALLSHFPDVPLTHTPTYCQRPNMQNDKAFSKNLSIPLTSLFCPSLDAVCLRDLGSILNLWWTGIYFCTWICQNTLRGEEIHGLPSAVHETSPLASFLLYYIPITMPLIFFFLNFDLKLEVKILFYQK